MGDELELVQEREWPGARLPQVGEGVELGAIQPYTDEKKGSMLIGALLLPTLEVVRVNWRLTSESARRGYSFTALPEVRLARFAGTDEQLEHLEALGWEPSDSDEKEV